MEYLGDAFLSIVSNPVCFLALVLGCSYGIIMGAMPGLGSVLAIATILPFTYTMDQTPALVLVLSVYCCSVYGGSISAVLINTPGTPNNAACCLDGHPMAKKGDADLALGYVTISSVIGGLCSILVLIFAAPQLAAIGLRFGPVETFALICLALTCIIGISRESMLKGILSAILGLFIATVGGDPITGDIRFDFGYFPLSAGIGLIAVLMGVFALGEVFTQVAKPPSEIHQNVGRVGFRVAPLREWILRGKTLVKSILIGSWFGVLPGVGAAIASFIAYGEAKRAGRFRDRLGTGEPEGVIASEASNNAVTGGALVPTLALGIPGDPVTAVMMSALIMQGIQPGVRLLEDNPEVLYVMFVALIFVNITMGILGALSAPLWTRILRMPRAVLLTLITILALVGTYGVRGNTFDLLIAFLAGIVGFLMRYAGFPIVPLVIGMVLGPIFESNLRQGLILEDHFFGFFTHPIAVVLFAFTTLFVVWPLFRTWREQKKQY